MTITINMAALFGILLGGSGIAVIATASLTAMLAIKWAWIGLVLLILGALSMLEYLLQRHFRRLVERELAAYELGRLRAVS